MTALRRVNIRLYESVISTEVTLPIVSTIILLFVLNVVLDWNFILAAQSIIYSDPSIRPTHDLTIISKWSEIQVQSNLDISADKLKPKPRLKLKPKPKLKPMPKLKA